MDLEYPLWMTLRAAVAENFDQLDAMPSHLRLSCRKRSEVVSECMYAF